MKKKTLALLMACMLLLGAAVGGTVAWLTAQTGPVENTFTVGDITLDILESSVDGNGKKIDGTTTKENAYHFVPGDTLPKDPWVVVKAQSEPCYLFIHAVETYNSAGTVEKVIHWSVDTETKGWKPVVINGQEVPNYWYQEITSMTEQDTKYSILTGDQVTVDENVTKEMVAGLKSHVPTLTFTAAAVQMDNLDFATAWEKLPEGF